MYGRIRKHAAVRRNIMDHHLRMLELQVWLRVGDDKYYYVMLANGFYICATAIFLGIKEITFEGLQGYQGGTGGAGAGIL